MKKVAVLGGTGAIGSRVVNILKNEYYVKASYCTRVRASEKNCEYGALDISDVEAIKAFCKECSAIVNCAGASFLNGEKVARVAQELQIPYVDTSGEAFLEEKLADIEKNNIFVFSSGYYPGLSGLLMRHICESFDVPEKILGLSVSEEIPSQSAIEDFILTNLVGFGTALSYYDEGKIKRDDKALFEIINNRKYMFQNYLTVEAGRIGKRFNLKQANWYNCSFGDEIVRKLQEAVVKFKVGDDAYKQIVEEVIKIFERNTKDIEQFTYIKVEGQGIVNNRRISRRAEISSHCSSQLSAIIVAYTVKTLLNSEHKNGIYYAMDIIDSNELIKAFESLKVEFRLKDIEEKGIQDEYEEGDI